MGTALECVYKDIIPKQNIPNHKIYRKTKQANLVVVYLLLLQWLLLFLFLFLFLLNKSSKLLQCIKSHFKQT